MAARFWATLCLLLVSTMSLAQAPDEDWQTISTENFRIHFPTEYEEWARYAGGKLESIRRENSRSIGYAPLKVTDVIVADPMAVPNGSAWPLVDGPVVILWTTAPGAGSTLSQLTDWPELVAIHEDAHVVHLVRPSRDRLERVLWYLSPAPLGPMTSAPRWAIEGYATVIEGELTQRGRPYSDIRAAILRRWAQDGRLPSYGSLASDGKSWMGQSMAYLVGSAYLEWLMEREGEESLRNVWARLTAKHDRTFDEAFQGVFGDSPQRLYQRFSAEITQRAMTAEKATSPTLREGELWQDYAWFTDAPDIDPAGELLVTVRKTREGPFRLVVIPTDFNTQAETRWQENVDKILARDPEDVAPVRRTPLPREPRYQLSGRSGAQYSEPRWIAETGHVLFSDRLSDRSGVYHSDLFRWNPKTGKVSRLTVDADLRDADPIEKGGAAVAVRNRYGLNEIVRVNFSSGEAESLTRPSITDLYSTPRMSPDEESLAYVMLRDGRWNLILRDLTTREESHIEFEGRIAEPAWSEDGSHIYASVGTNGFVEIWDFPVNGSTLGSGRAMTRGRSPALAPAPAGDVVYFLSLDPDGVDIRTVALDPALDPLPDVVLGDDLSPTVRRLPEKVPPRFESEHLGAARHYGLGHFSYTPLYGGSWSPSGGTLDLGARAGEVLGRAELFGLVSLGSSGGPSGGLLSGTWRGWPVDVGVRLFQLEETPGEASFEEGFAPLVPDRERTGVEIDVSKVLRWTAFSLMIDGSVFWNSVDPKTGESFDQWASLGSVTYFGSPSAESWSYPQHAQLAVSVGSTDGQSFSRVVGEASFGVLRKGTGARLTVARGNVGDGAHPFDLFEVGGLRRSIHASNSLVANRVFVAGLPQGVLAGSSYTRARIDLSIKGLPVEVFYDYVETSLEDTRTDISHAGVEYRYALERMPILRLPSIEVRAGLSISLDRPVEDDVEGWIGLRWRP